MPPFTVVHAPEGTELRTRKVNCPLDGVVCIQEECGSAQRGGSVHFPHKKRKKTRNRGTVHTSGHARCRSCYRKRGGAPGAESQRPRRATPSTSSCPHSPRLSCMRKGRYHDKNVSLSKTKCCIAGGARTAAAGRPQHPPAGGRPLLLTRSLRVLRCTRLRDGVFLSSGWAATIQLLDVKGIWLDTHRARKGIEFLHVRVASVTDSAAQRFVRTRP